MESIKLRFYLLLLQPTHMLAIAVFLIVYFLVRDWLAALLWATVLSVATCLSCPDFPILRKLYTLYCQWCIGKHSENCQKLRKVCDDPDSHSFCGMFRTVWKETSNTFVASSIRAVEELVLFAIPLIFVIIWAPMLSSDSRTHAQLALLDIGALAGNLFVVMATHHRLPEQPFPYVKHLGYVLSLLIVCIIFSGVIIYVSESRIAFTRISPMGWHAVGVLVVSVLLFYYDLLALRGVRSLTTSNGDGEAELFETCVIVDLPVVVSLGFVVAYWFRKHDELRETCNALLTGALVLQFMISAVQFVLVKERIVSKMSHKSNVDRSEKRARGQSA